MKQSVVIEAFGMPAVGKSYVSERLIASRRRLSYSINGENFSISSKATLNRIRIKVSNIFILIPRIFNNAAKIYGIAKAVRWRSKRAMAQAFFNWLQVLAMINRSRDLDLVLTQGLFQALWSFIIRSEFVEDPKGFPCDRWWEVTRAMIGPKMIVILIVKARESEIKERLTSRIDGQSIIDKSNDDELWQQALHISQSVESFIKSISEKDKQLVFIEFLNNLPLNDASASKLWSEIDAAAPR